MSQRKQKREAKRLEEKLKEKLTSVTESFTSELLNNMVNVDDEIFNQKYEILNREWRSFAGKTIRLNPKIYSNPKAKERLLNAFEVFCQQTHERVTKLVEDVAETKVDNEVKS